MPGYQPDGFVVRQWPPDASSVSGGGGGGGGEGGGGSGRTLAEEEWPSLQQVTGGNRVGSSGQAAASGDWAPGGSAPGLASQLTIHNAVRFSDDGGWWSAPPPPPPPPPSVQPREATLEDVAPPSTEVIDWWEGGPQKSATAEPTLGEVERTNTSQVS